MEQNRFFKWLWRINAIGLFFLLGAGLYSFIKSEIRNHSRHEIIAEPITSVANDPKGVEKWTLGYGQEIIGLEYIMLPLISKYSKVKMLNQMPLHKTNYYIYNENIAKNILFVNNKDNSSHWLFPTNNQLIVEYSTLMSGTTIPYVEYDKNEIKKTKIIYYKVIDKDTTGDKAITVEDKQSFAISDVTGKNYRVVISKIDRVIYMRNIKNRELHIVYQKDGVGHSLKFDIDKFETISDVVLPKVGG